MKLLAIIDIMVRCARLGVRCARPGVRCTRPGLDWGQVILCCGLLNLTSGAGLAVGNGNTEITAELALTGLYNEGPHSWLDGGFGRFSTGEDSATALVTKYASK